MTVKTGSLKSVLKRMVVNKELLVIVPAIGRRHATYRCGDLPKSGK